MTEDFKCDGDCENCDLDKSDTMMKEFLATIGAVLSPEELLDEDSEVIKLNLTVSKNFVKILQRFVIFYSKEDSYEDFLDTFMSLLFNESLMARMEEFGDNELPKFLEWLAENRPASLESLSRISMKTFTRSGRMEDIRNEIVKQLKGRESTYGQEERTHNPKGTDTRSSETQD